MHILLLLSFTLCFSSLNAQDAQEKHISQNISDENIDKVRNSTLLEKWQVIESRTKTAVNVAIKALLPHLIQNQEKVNISSKCMGNVFHLIGGLRKIKTWAFRFIDSSAKSIDGLLYGSVSSFGDYDECVENVVKSEGSQSKGKLLYKGQYCAMEITPPLPPKKKFYKISEPLEEFKELSKSDTIIGEVAKNAQFFFMTSSKIGICIPSGCSLNDLNEVAKLLGNFTGLHVKATRCEVKEETKFLPIQIFVTIIFSFLALLLIIGTIIDLYKDHYELIYKSRVMKSLLAFSIIKNFQDFSNIETTSNLFRCLPGIRFLCMGWIILCHTYFLLNHQAMMDAMNLKDFIADFTFQAICNPTIAVETFFCMSAILVSYFTLKKMKKDKKHLNIVRHITHRLWRILPAYIGTILFVFLGNLLGSGPTWHDMGNKHFNACFKNWWTNILFINNFYHADNMCLIHSWYIAADMQMFIVSTFIIILISRYPKIGLSLCVAIVFAAICYSGIATCILDYPPTMLMQHPDNDDLREYMVNFYFLPFPHMSSYAIGLVVGYILLEKPDLKIPKVYLVLGWSLAFIVTSSVIFGPLNWNKGVDPSFWAATLYASFHKTAWSLGISWMIVCCLNGYGGVINYILSWKVFIPLGRLTFLAYLIHPIVQIIATGTIRSKVQATHAAIVYMFLGHFCISFSLAFIANMMVESPVAALEEIFFPTKKQMNANIKNGSVNGILNSEKMYDIAVVNTKNSEETFGNDNNISLNKF